MGFGLPILSVHLQSGQESFHPPQSGWHRTPYLRFRELTPLVRFTSSPPPESQTGRRNPAFREILAFYSWAAPQAAREATRGAQPERNLFMRGPHLAKVLVILLVLLLSVPSVQAAGFKTQSGSSLEPLHLRMVTWAWNLLAAAWGENGCRIDPDGRCLPSEPANTLDNGCRADPDGRCLPDHTASTSDNGCGMDPNGLCQH